MQLQTDLFSTPLREPEPLALEPQTLEEAFRQFHALNPHVYAGLVRLAEVPLRRGFKRYGFPGVWEVLRYRHMETTGDLFKLNNNYRAFYARLIAYRRPEVGALFELRHAPNGADAVDYSTVTP